MKFRQFINEKSQCPKSGCIQKKENGKWGIISGKTGKWWDAEYDTKSDAEAGLKAYFVHKNESVRTNRIQNSLHESKSSAISIEGNPNEKIPVLTKTRKEIIDEINDIKNSWDLGNCTQKDFNTYLKNYGECVKNSLDNNEDISMFMEEVLDLN